MGLLRKIEPAEYAKIRKHVLGLIFRSGPTPMRLGSSREIAKEFGYEEWFYFRGHGIGAATHIPPSFVPGSHAVLEQNMTFAYEPMFVRQGFGTACVEDLYVVTATGCERLGEAPERWWA